MTRREKRRHCRKVRRLFNTAPILKPFKEGRDFNKTLKRTVNFYAEAFEKQAEIYNQIINGQFMMWDSEYFDFLPGFETTFYQSGNYAYCTEA